MVKRRSSMGRAPDEPPVSYHAGTGYAEGFWTPAQRSYFSAFGFQSLVGIPLVLGEQLIGMLSVRIAVDRHIDEEALEFAQALAQQATLALEFERLAEQSKQTALMVERKEPHANALPN